MRKAAASGDQRGPAAPVAREGRTRTTPCARLLPPARVDLWRGFDDEDDRTCSTLWAAEWDSWPDRGGIESAEDRPCLA
ncbi:hypothetical protein GCM10009730_03720 [Streptomyces albidochromogenes]|uniref:hypothetical protein n=1 Tax=Streptomyces albidochromogenes TaxID=329524 RepID=UPI00110FAD49|nr:hypothetical protein [Streptomyces albidochromogenes]